MESLGQKTIADSRAEMPIRCACGTLVSLSLGEKAACPQCGCRYPAWPEYSRTRTKAIMPACDPPLSAAGRAGPAAGFFSEGPG